MSEDHNQSPDISDLGRRVGSVEQMLQHISERLGYSGLRPGDPLEAARWEIPLLRHISELRDSVHALRNHAQVFSSLVELLGAKLDRNAAVSQENAEALSKLLTAIDRIERSSAIIERNVAVAVRENTLLMRDLAWIDTNATEIYLIIFVGGEAMIFLIGSDSLLRSAMFSAMSAISQRSLFWGLLCMALAAFGAAAFVSRKKTLRILAAFSIGAYFLVTGSLTLFFSGGVLGWLPHLVAGAAASWIVYRGPSRAT